MKNWMFAWIIAALPACAGAAPENYTVDPEHTYPSLEFSHMGLSIWRGRFNHSSGKVMLDRAQRTGTAEIQVDTNSIDFGHPKMKDFAITEDWLDTAKFPTMTYKGKIQYTGDMPSAVDGQLTLRGVTRPVKLRINSFKCMPHPMIKTELCGADAEGDLDRADFGMALYTDGGMGRIHLRIQVEALKD